jgi:hypothetical protein
MDEPQSLGDVSLDSYSWELFPGEKKMAVFFVFCLELLLILALLPVE